MRMGVIVGVIIAAVVVTTYMILSYGRGIEGYRYIKSDIVAVETEEYPVYIDIAFEEGDRRGIEGAIVRWNKVLNGYRRMEVEDRKYLMEDEEVLRRGVRGEAYLILRIGNNSDLLNDREGGITLAFTNEIGGTIMYIVPERISGLRVEGVSMYGVVLHEIGHWMGARHVESGLMGAKYDVVDYLCVDEGTARQVSRWFRGYDWRRMNYCVRE